MQDSQTDLNDRTSLTILIKYCQSIYIYIKHWFYSDGQLHIYLCKQIIPLQPVWWTLNNPQYFNHWLQLRNR